MPHPQEIDATEKQRWGALYTIDGWGIHRIARRYGRSTHTVWKFLRAAGVVRSREEAAQAIVSSGRRTWKGGRQKGSREGVPLSEEHRAALSAGQRERWAREAGRQRSR